MYLFVSLGVCCGVWLIVLFVYSSLALKVVGFNATGGPGNELGISSPFADQFRLRTKDKQGDCVAAINCPVNSMTSKHKHANHSSKKVF